MPNAAKEQVKAVVAEGATPRAREVAEAAVARADGPMMFTPNPLIARIPRYWVYIFSVFPATRSVAKGNLGTFTVPACPLGERVSTPIRLNSIVSSSYFDPFTQTTKTDDVSGEYVAQDICRPFLGGDWSEGQNLDDYGVFWTKNEHPTDAEVGAAREKMERTMRKLLDIATGFETTNQLTFITPDMRLAASYFGEDRPWNKIYKKVSECPVCGQPAKPGIVIHTCGAIMPGMWGLAIKNGLRSRAQAEEAGVDFAAEGIPPLPKAPK